MADLTPQELHELQGFHDDKLKIKGSIAMMADVLLDDELLGQLYTALQIEATSADPTALDNAKRDRWDICNLNQTPANDCRAAMDKADPTDENLRKIALRQAIYNRMMAYLVDYNNIKADTDRTNKPLKQVMADKLQLIGDKAKVFQKFSTTFGGKTFTTLSDFQNAVAALPSDIKADFDHAQQRAKAKRLYMEFIDYAPGEVPRIQTKLDEAEDKKRISPNWAKDPAGKLRTDVDPKDVVELDRQTDYSPSGNPSSKRVNLMRVSNCVLGRKEFLDRIYNDLDNDVIVGATGPHADDLNTRVNPARKILFKTSSEAGAPVWGICAKVENNLVVFYKYKLDDWTKNKSMGLAAFLADSKLVQPMYGYDFDAKLCNKDGSALGDDGYLYSKTVRHLVSETPRHVCEYAKKNVIDANHNVIQRGDDDAAGAKVKKTLPAAASHFSASAGTAVPDPSVISASTGIRTKP